MFSLVKQCYSRLSIGLANHRMINGFSPVLNGAKFSTNDQSINDTLYKRIELEARSADRGVLDSYEQFVLMAAKFFDINVSRTWEPFRQIKRRTLLRAAFVKKKYRVQYEFRTYFRSIELKYLTGSTADTFLEYIERNLPEGTALKVTRDAIERMPEHLKPPEQLQQSSQ